MHRNGRKILNSNRYYSSKHGDTHNELWMCELTWYYEHPQFASTKNSRCCVKNIERIVFSGKLKFCKFMVTDSDQPMKNVWHKQRSVEFNAHYCCGRSCENSLFFSSAIYIRTVLRATETDYNIFYSFSPLPSSSWPFSCLCSSAHRSQSNGRNVRTCGLYLKRTRASEKLRLQFK